MRFEVFVGVEDHTIRVTTSCSLVEGQNYFGGMYTTSIAMNVEKKLGSEILKATIPSVGNVDNGNSKNSWRM